MKSEPLWLLATADLLDALFFPTLVDAIETIDGLVAMELTRD